MLFGQLVCYGCQRILTYPLGAITCRCRLCNTINAAQNLQVTCGACGQELHAPINTLSLLCPCCGTVTDIPEELLPPLPSCINLGDGSEEMETAIYVSHPTLPPVSRSTTPADAPPLLSPLTDVTAATATMDRRPSRTAKAEANAAQRRMTREEREIAQGKGDARDDDDAYEMEVIDEGERTRAAATGPAHAAPMRLAPTVMIATRIL